jgi:carboxyl-terminal processing protease
LFVITRRGRGQTLAVAVAAVLLASLAVSLGGASAQSEPGTTLPATTLPGATVPPTSAPASTSVTTVPGATIPGATIPVATSTSTSVAVAQTTAQYVHDALEFIEQASFRKSSVDWPMIKANAQAKAEKTTTFEQAYEVIVDTLKLLNDNHSSFTRPPEAQQQTQGQYNGFGFVAVWPSRVVITVVPGSPAAGAGMLLGDVITKIDGKTPPHTKTNIAIPRNKQGEFPDKILVTITRKSMKRPKNLLLKVGTVTLISVPTAAVLEVKPKLGSEVGGVFGYLDVPGIIGDPTAQKLYAQELQDAIRTTDATKRCGWVIDLRKNRGGYIYAILNGLGPLVGPGPLAGQLNAAGVSTLWSYKQGTLFSGDAATVSIDNPYEIAEPYVPTAILTSHLTASAAEATTIAFRGRPNSRSFGESTLGLTTFNVRKRMSDGAFLDILNAVDIDRNGSVYDGPVSPDQLVMIDWANIGTPNDLVLNAATDWLSKQQSCQGGPR